MKIKKAVFPVAGFGTRFLPFTKAVPKEMLPIIDTPVLQILVEEVVKSGIEEIIMVTSQGKNAIENHFDRCFHLEYLLKEKGKMKELEQVKKIAKMAKFIYVRQDQPKGDGHAILCAREIIKDEPFLVVFGDDIIKAKETSTSQLLKAYEQHQNCIVAVKEVPDKEISNFGIVKPKDKGEEDCFEIKSMVEKPSLSEAPSNLAIIGKYVCTPEIFEAIENIGQEEKSKDGELRLIDALIKLSSTQAIYGQKIKGERFDAGSKTGFLKATIDAALSDEEIRDDFIEYFRSKIG